MTSVSRPVVLAFAVATFVALPASAQTHQLVDLTARGFRGACCINSAGEVAGYGTSGALIYSNGVVTNIGRLPDGGHIWPAAISATGAVTGSAETGSYYTDPLNEGVAIVHAFLYANGAMTDLGTLPGVGGQSYGTGINASGVIAGTDVAVAGSGVSPVSHAFLYNGGALVDIGTFPGGQGTYAKSINSSGQVAGLAYNANGFAHAFRYSRGVMQDLGTLGGSSSEATAINDNGLTTGFADTTHGYTDAFISDGATMTDIGNLGGMPPAGAVRSTGWGINESGLVVGWSYIPATDQAGNSIPRAFLYSNGVMVDLNSLVDPNDPLQPVTLVQAYAINDVGSIVAASNGNVYLLVAAGSAIPPPQPRTPPPPSPPTPTATPTPTSTTSPTPTPATPETASPAATAQASGGGALDVFTLLALSSLLALRGLRKRSARAG
jgi:probable HAF family extracellular repeat protein